eukprot:PhF_6_TR29177/c0_g1_i1/m.42669
MTSVWACTKYKPSPKVDVFDLSPLHTTIPPPPPKRCEKEPPTHGIMYWGRSTHEVHKPVSSTQFQPHDLSMVTKSLLPKGLPPSDVRIGNSKGSLENRRCDFTAPDPERLLCHQTKPIGGPHEKTYSNVYMVNPNTIGSWATDQCQSMTHRQFVYSNEQSRNSQAQVESHHNISTGSDPNKQSIQHHTQQQPVVTSKQRGLDNQREMMKSHFSVGTEKGVGYETSTKSQYINRTFGKSVRPESAFTQEQRFHSDVPLKNNNINWANISKTTTSTFFDGSIHSREKLSRPLANGLMPTHVSPRAAGRNVAWNFGMDRTKRWVTTSQEAYRSVEYGPASGNGVQAVKMARAGNESSNVVLR